MKAHSRHTAMGLAMVNALVLNPQHKMRGSIIKAADAGSGTKKENDWNAKLAYRTSVLLKSFGVIN